MCNGVVRGDGDSVYFLCFIVYVPLFECVVTVVILRCVDDSTLPVGVRVTG